MPPKARLTTEERHARKQACTKRWKLANRAHLKAYQAAWITANAEHVRGYNRTQTRANPAKNRARVAAWNAANPGRSLTRSATWRRENPEKNRASIRRWEHAHPESHAISTHKRRAHKMNAPRNDLTKAQWLMIQAAQDHCCAYCGARSKGHLTQDHITPLSQGGSHTLHNVIGACRFCNSKKHVGPPLAPVQPLLL